MPSYNPNDYDPNKSGFLPPPEGEYPFTVTHAEEKTSKAGNAMIELELACDIGRDKPLTVYDRLVFVTKAIYRVHGFCATVDLNFDSGEIYPDDCMGQSGKAHLALGEANTNGKRYMEVAWYCEREGYSEQPAGTKAPAATPREPAQSDEPPAYTDDPTGGENIPF